MDYDSFSPKANKILNADGSVTTLTGEPVFGPDPGRAAMYEMMSPIANKLLNPDGSISTFDEIGSGGGVTPGQTVSIAVGTVTTGAPGTNVIIDNSGTSTNAVFDFTIPRGDTGLQGIQGQKGEQGPQGLPGEAAVANIQYKGLWAPGTFVKNDCVIALTDGNSYVCVAESTTQEPGIDGNDDWSLWVMKGPAGPQGAQGVQGYQGQQGQQGIQGIQGPAGSAGTPGAQGPQGSQGLPGAQGEQGPQGQQGATGQQGPQGPAGEKGEQGPQGEQGEKGEQGPEGSPGATDWAGITNKPISNVIISQTDLTAGVSQLETNALYFVYE